MSAKKLTINLGGIDRELKFGTMLFFKHAAEVYNGDPMELVYGINTADLLSVNGNKEEAIKLITGIKDPVKLFYIILAFVYAGLACNGAVHTKEEVEQWVSDMGFNTGFKVLEVGRAALTESSNGKPGEKDAQMIVNQAQ